MLNGILMHVHYRKMIEVISNRSNSLRYPQQLNYFCAVILIGGVIHLGAVTGRKYQQVVCLYKLAQVAQELAARFLVQRQQLPDLQRGFLIG